MKQKNRTYKNRKGGFLEKRWNSLYDSFQQGTTPKTAKTYCCASKESGSNDILSSGTNVGKTCKRSYTGQCLPGYGTGNNYKFRCFDSKFNDNNTITEINDNKRDTNKCEYISGALSKVGKTAVAAGIGFGHIASATLNSGPLALALVFSSIVGGDRKKRKSRSTRKSKKNKK